MRQTGKLFDYPRVFTGSLNAYVLASLEYCAPCRCRRRRLIWIYWTLLFAVRYGYCEGELRCLGHRIKVSVLCLLYKIYYRVNLL